MHVSTYMYMYMYMYYTHTTYIMYMYMYLCQVCTYSQATCTSMPLHTPGYNTASFPVSPSFILPLPLTLRRFCPAAEGQHKIYQWKEGETGNEGYSRAAQKDAWTYVLSLPAQSVMQNVSLYTRSGTTYTVPCTWSIYMY